MDLLDGLRESPQTSKGDNNAPIESERDSEFHEQNSYHNEITTYEIYPIDRVNSYPRSTT